MRRNDGEVAFENTILPMTVEKDHHHASIEKIEELSSTILPDSMQRNKLSPGTIGDDEHPLQASSRFLDCSKSGACSLDKSDVQLLRQALGGALLSTSGIEACNYTFKPPQTDCRGNGGASLQDSTRGTAVEALAPVQPTMGLLGKDSTPLEYTLSTDASLTLKSFTETLEVCPEEASVHLGMKLPSASKFALCSVSEKSGIDAPTSNVSASGLGTHLEAPGEGAIPQNCELFIPQNPQKLESLPALHTGLQNPFVAVAPESSEPSSTSKEEALPCSSTLRPGVPDGAKACEREAPISQSVGAERSDVQFTSPEEVAITPPLTPHNSVLSKQVLVSPDAVERSKTKYACKKCCVIM
jgi:hypothetical protein